MTSRQLVAVAAFLLGSASLAVFNADRRAFYAVDCERRVCAGLDEADEPQSRRPDPPPAVAPPVPAESAAVEQTAQGTGSSVPMIESFDGLGAGFTGPQGAAATSNPSDNSLAAGPNHIVQIVNSRLAIFDKKGTVLYGPVVTNTIFEGFGGPCEKQISGDAVVRYDQLADRWLYVLPVFRRPPGEPEGPYSMCYAISQGADPKGPYYRYEFKRPLFPDYPRPAIWPDGYYVPTSTGDEVIQKHACVADRSRMLQGLPATEQCVIVEGANFLNNADIDGKALPPAGAPNIVMAAGGTQLKGKFDDDGIYVYKFHVDWKDKSKTSLTGPVKIRVAPYHYLCNGQLTSCVPQPDTERRLDAQGDKLMQRLVYRNIDGRESIYALHSVNTKSGGGGVRWYEFRLGANRDPYLFQQGTYAPDGFFRWMGSLGVDRQGNLGIGYSFGGAPNFVGQRFAGRLVNDAPGTLGARETVMVEGAAPQTNAFRWEDYTTTAIDPGDDCTFWYVGDYLKSGAASYTSRIASFRFPGCPQTPAAERAWGNRCLSNSRGARDARFWAGAKGKALLITHDREWRDLVNSILHLTRRNGERFTVPPDGGEAYEALRVFVKDSAADSVQLLLAALNVYFGQLDGKSGVHDPVLNDWTTVQQLLNRASEMNPRKYSTLLKQLNANSAQVTSTADGCPASTP